MDNKYYVFDSHGYLNTMAGIPNIVNEAIAKHDGSGTVIMHQLIFGEYSPELHFPIDFQIEENGKIRDVIEMRWPSAFLISDRLKEIFTTEGLTGWRPYDVVVWSKKGEIIPGYSGFSVIGRNPEEKGTGAQVLDFFKFSGLWIICTQKVVDVLKKYKIKDFEIRPIDENFNDGMLGKINF